MIKLLLIRYKQNKRNMKNILNKLLAFWGLLIAPFKAYLDKRKAEKEKVRLEKERVQSIKDLKNSFSKKYNVDIDKSVKAMEAQKAKQTDKDFLTNELIKARKYMNENGIQPGGGQVTDVDAIRRQMPIYGSKYFSDHIRKALRIGLDILKEREAHVSLESTTEKVSEQP